jgi:hypothetical protein
LQEAVHIYGFVNYDYQAPSPGEGESGFTFISYPFSYMILLVSVFYGNTAVIMLFPEEMMMPGLSVAAPSRWGLNFILCGL